MGGYNTAAELLALGKWALVMPRNWRYGEHAKGTKAGLEWEQLMRAQAMERMGLQQVIVPETLSPESLAVDILSGLSRNQRSNPPRLQVGGVEQVVEQILLTIEARKRRAQV